MCKCLCERKILEEIGDGDVVSYIQGLCGKLITNKSTVKSNMSSFNLTAPIECQLSLGFKVDCSDHHFKWRISLDRPSK